MKDKRIKILKKDARAAASRNGLTRIRVYFRKQVQGRWEKFIEILEGRNINSLKARGFIECTQKGCVFMRFEYV